ncbi:MAG: putative metal-binding motif-containing protein [Myxococcota bacterium]
MRLLPLLCLLAACPLPEEDDEDDKDTGEPVATTEDTAEPEIPPDTGEPVDRDGDGYHADQDCDDEDPRVNPGATEVCDGVDDDCDGTVDEGVTVTSFADADGDGFGDPSSSVEACEVPAGYVPAASDCDDADAGVYPGAPERCDGRDEDCDGVVDEGCVR